MIDANPADCDAIYDALVDHTNETTNVALSSVRPTFDAGRLMARYLSHFIVIATDGTQF